MSRRTRRVVALVALCVAASMALGVGSYSSVSAERSVSVTVVDDESAYLGVPGGTLQCEHEHNTLFYNQFPEPVTGGHVNITPKDGDLTIRHDGRVYDAHRGQEITLRVEEKVISGGQFEVQLRRVGGSADSVTVDIEVSGPTFNVSTTETRGVDCEKQTVLSTDSDDGDDGEDGEDSGDGDDGEDSGDGDDGDGGDGDGDDGDDGDKGGDGDDDED